MHSEYNLIGYLFLERPNKLKNISAKSYIMMSKKISSNKYFNYYLPGYDDVVYNTLIKHNFMFFRNIPNPTIDMYKTMFETVLLSNDIIYMENSKKKTVNDKFKYIFEDILKDRSDISEFLDYLQSTNLNEYVKKYVESFRPKPIVNKLTVHPDIHESFPENQVVS